MYNFSYSCSNSLDFFHKICYHVFFGRFILIYPQIKKPMHRYLQNYKFTSFHFLPKYHFHKGIPWKLCQKTYFYFFKFHILYIFHYWKIILYIWLLFLCFCHSNIHFVNSRYFSIHSLFNIGSLKLSTMPGDRRH